MQTDLPAELLATSAGARANEILRSCVHCGFCNATCPTYQVTGDELDGPRGRIYLMRELLQGSEDRERVTQHLDRCLTCRACETTCPSGVAYGELAEISRNMLGPGRGGIGGGLRKLLRWMVPHPDRLRLMNRLGWWTRGLLPASLAQHVSRVASGVADPSQAAPTVAHDRSVIVLDGCAQQVSTPDTNHHLVHLLDAHDVAVVRVPGEGCCGSLALHLGDEAGALMQIRANVDALHAHLNDAEAIVSTASGCGVTVKDYGRLLAHDPDYADKAAAVAAATQDVGEYLASSGLTFSAARDFERVAWHAPCTLQHGQRSADAIPALLRSAGYDLVEVADAHLCCGSAGTYSMLQPEMSNELRDRKLAALNRHAPEVIVSANVGCQTHLGHAASVPVLHWIELLE